MKLLHILRSEPNELVKLLVARMSQGASGQQVPLYQGPVDYDRLVADIFRSDMVICWW